MNAHQRSVSLSLVLLFSVLSAASCSSSGVDDLGTGGAQGSGGRPGSGGTWAASDDGFYEGPFAEKPSFPGPMSGTGGKGPTPSGCVPPRAIPLPARKAVMSEAVSSGSRPIFTRDLFSRFQSYCGGCHVDTSLGGFDDQRVTFDNFPELVGSDAITLMQSDDPDVFMPKPVAGGKPWSERPEGDPIRELSAELERWIAAGSPPEVFYLESEGADDESPYLMTKAQGENLTNLGNCLPNEETFAKEEKKSKELDDFFKKAEDLPANLRDTDLFTLDSEILSNHGVFAVAPTYPLWSENAGKIRQVRLPRGKSLAFDPDTNEFKIPENTRVYKTFLKEVLEEDGRVAYRKIETRLIVSRPDDCSSGACVVRSLYGTYAWNDDETEAMLVQDPLRDGTPFRDRLITYITDEKKAAEAGADIDLLTKATRHYAIPGGSRCLQCHMGSPTGSFLLGLSPVQLNRLAYVEEPNDFALGAELLGDGVLEEDDPLPDELDQLDRLIDLGVVSGLASPTEVVHLKDLGQEKPRNNLELRAQGYMLGNCSGCHNPRGFPSVKLPDIAPLLNFYPSQLAGSGIFKFPLERYSPRVFRGVNADYEVPYITPSLWDRPGGTQSSATDLQISYWNKCIGTLSDRDVCVEAPWRSLIYRNVDTPFTGVDDYAIYPHMPRHVAGFDCRAPRLLGEWMVSVPSRTKTIPKGQTESDMVDPQPHLAVDASDEDYDVAVNRAKARLRRYRDGERYSYCPDTSDIVDPEVLSGKFSSPRDLGQYLPGQPAVRWRDGAPDRPHFAVTDLTTLPGDWTPRRADWADVLLGEDPQKVAQLGAAERRVVEILDEFDLEITPEFKDFALKPRVLGIWKRPSDGRCDAALSAFPNLSDLPPEEVPYWRYVTGATTQGRVYSASAGGAVFGMICRNCHGPSANGDSALGDTISDITGGAARVANLRDGLFGPVTAPGNFADKIFGERAESLGISSQALASRYLLWMALGGTKIDIPIVALKIVQNARFIGEKRFGANLPSANMLSNAEEICRATLPAGTLDQGSSSSVATAYNSAKAAVEYDLLKGMDMGSWNYLYGAPLVIRNGDAGLWVELCTARQTSPVRGLFLNFEPDSEYVAPLISTKATVSPTGSEFSGMYLLLDPEEYGDNPLMTPDGIKRGVPFGESQVWCLARPQTEIGLERAIAWSEANLVDGEPYPLCPEGVRDWTVEDQKKFVTKGAMTVGLAVFTYLRAIAEGEIQPQLQYDECEKLPAP